MTPDQYKHYLRAAYQLALQSPDPSTQNAAFVFNANDGLVGEGVNEFTRGMPVTADLLERPKKYSYIEHAERNAIYDVFSRLYKGSPYTMVCPWASCADCARAIVQSGIRTLVRHCRDDETGRWGGSIEDGDIILTEGGVEIIEIRGELGGCDPILFNGEWWTP